MRYSVLKLAALSSKQASRQAIGMPLAWYYGTGRGEGWCPIMS